MATSKTTRKKRFRMALAAAGMSQGQWAEANGITPGYLSNVLNGNVESERLCKQLDTWTDEQLRKAKVGS